MIFTSLFIEDHSLKGMITNEAVNIALKLQKKKTARQNILFLQNKERFMKHTEM